MLIESETSSYASLEGKRGKRRTRGLAHVYSRWVAELRTRPRALTSSRPGSPYPAVREWGEERTSFLLPSERGSIKGEGEHGGQEPSDSEMTVGLPRSVSLRPYLSYR